MKCPLCGSTYINQIIQTYSWSISACKNCTNAWTDPPPSETQYSERDFHSSNVESDSSNSPIDITDLPLQWQHSIRMQAKLINRYLDPGARILEIGCGEGILLSQLVLNGFEVQGIEPSKTACARARKKGLNVINDYFSSSIVDGPYDTVILSHVLEHLANPIDILKQVRKIMPGGLLLLVQTNYQGIVPLVDKEKWYAWVPQDHYWHFSPLGVKHISQPLGYKEVSCEYSSLVHNGYEKTMSQIASIIPKFLDQFHILLRNE